MWSVSFDPKFAKISPAKHVWSSQDLTSRRLAMNHRPFDVLGTLRVQVFHVCPDSCPSFLLNHIYLFRRRLAGLSSRSQLLASSIRSRIICVKFFRVFYDSKVIFPRNATYLMYFFCSRGCKRVSLLFLFFFSDIGHYLYCHLQCPAWDFHSSLS